MEDILLEEGLPGEQVGDALGRIKKLIAEIVLEGIGEALCDMRLRLEDTSGEVALERAIFGGSGETIREAAARAKCSGPNIHKLESKYRRKLVTG